MRRHLNRLLAAAVLAAGVSVVAPGTGQAAEPTAGLLWFNATAGTLAEWSLTGDGTVTHDFTWGDFSCSTDSGCAGTWRLIGVDDFDRDGVQDLLMHKPASGDLLVRLRTRTNSIRDNQLLDFRCDTGCVNDWRPVGIADLDGNGHPDLTWWNSTTGAVSSWLLDGAGHVLAISELDWRCGYDFGCSSDWKPLDLGDLNGDGRPDLLWHNRRSGELSAWLLGNARHVVTAQSLSWRCGTEYPGCSYTWTPIGIGDVNGDGWGDLMWHSRYSGRVASWLVNGSGGVMGVQELSWQCGHADGCSTAWTPVDLVDTDPPRLPTCPLCPRQTWRDEST